MLSMLEWLCTRSQVNEMTKGLNEQAQELRSHSLTDTRYPVICTDALYEKVRMNGRVVSMAVMVVCGVNEKGRDILAVEPMLDESKRELFPVVSKSFGSRPENTAAGGSRCEQRADCRHPRKFSRRILAAL